MKFDPHSKVRSQRENMQAFQLRLPKEVIRDLQLLRVFAQVKVSEELRNLVVEYIESKRPLLQKTVSGLNAEVTLATQEQVDAANALAESGDVETVKEVRTVKKVRVDVDAKGARVLTELPLSEHDKRTKTTVRK